MNVCCSISCINQSGFNLILTCPQSLLLMAACAQCLRSSVLVHQAPFHQNME